MTPATRREAAPAAAGAGEDLGDRGFTLVELLVAISIFAVLTTLVFGGLTSTVKTVDNVRSITNLTEEARVATERISRELRQASEITSYHKAVSGSNYTSVTFWVDFNGNRLPDENAVDPEVITYRYDPGSGQLSFIANDPAGTSVSRPILAENVTGFELAFTSSLWDYDTTGYVNGVPDGVPDGVTSWTEIDSSVVGNHNGVFDSGEFDKIDSIGITIELMDGTRKQTYTTQVDLRNRNQK